MTPPSLLYVAGRSARPRLVALGLAAASLGGCKKSLPTDDTADTSDTSDTDDGSDSDAEDSGLDGPAPRCAVEEEEPNDAPGTATALGLETRGCGTVGGPVDQDLWSFTLSEDAWLAVRVDAAQLGSRADVQATLAGGAGSLGVTGFDRPDNADVWIVVPAEQGDYTVSVGPQGVQGGGDDSFYEVLASVTKPPIEADVAEGDNGDPDDPQPLASAITGPDGVVVVGTLEGPTERDHYGVEVPAGRHRVVVTVQAQALGSPLDARLVVDDGTDRTLVDDSAFGSSADPVWEATFTGATSLVLELSASDGTGVPGAWYGLRVVVEDAL